jgi:hypothetical protein
VVSRPVGVGERWKWGGVWLTNEAAQHEREVITPLEVSETAPVPLAIRVEDLDLMPRGSSYPVSASRCGRDHRLDAIYEELAGLAGALVCRHVDTEILPLRAIGVAQAAETDQTPAG